MTFSCRRMKSAALTQAIFFIVCVSIICSLGILLFATHKKFAVLQNKKVQLILENHEAINHFLNSANSLDKYLHHSGDTSVFREYEWGLFTILNCRTNWRNLNCTQSVVVGQKNLSHLPSLTILVGSNPPTLGGTTRIEGDISVPTGNIDRIIGSDDDYKGVSLVEGKISDSRFTKLPFEVQFLEKKFEVVNKLPRNVLYDRIDTTVSFHSTTLELKLNDTFPLESNLAGNIIVSSDSKIIVSKKAKLKNVILFSPEVKFEKGFSGSVQIFASRRIYCDSGSYLKYPSSVVLNFKEGKENTFEPLFFLGRSAKVLGNVFCFADSRILANPILVMDTFSLIAGSCWSNKNVELRNSSIIGSMTTTSIIRSKGGTVTTNQLINLLISSKRLPITFLNPVIFEGIEYQRRRPVVWIKEN